MTVFHNIFQHLDCFWSHHNLFNTLRVLQGKDPFTKKVSVKIDDIQNGKILQLRLKRKTNGFFSVRSLYILPTAENINFLISVMVSLSKGRERPRTNSITVC